MCAKQQTKEGMKLQCLQTVWLEVLTFDFATADGDPPILHTVSVGKTNRRDVSRRCHSANAYCILPTPWSTWRTCQGCDKSFFSKLRNWRLNYYFQRPIYRPLARGRETRKIPGSSPEDRTEANTLQHNANGRDYALLSHAIAPPNSNSDVEIRIRNRKKSYFALPMQRCFPGAPVIVRVVLHAIPNRHNLDGVDSIWTLPPVWRQFPPYFSSYLLGPC